MKTLNVRLSEEDAGLVADLKARGFTISDVVRNALREGMRRYKCATSKKPTKQLIDAIFERNPEPDHASEIKIKSKDSRALSDMIAADVRADHRRIINDYLHRHKRTAGAGKNGRSAARRGKKRPGPTA